MAKVIVGYSFSLDNAKPPAPGIKAMVDVWLNHKGGHKSLPEVDCPVCADLKAKFEHGYRCGLTRHSADTTAARVEDMEGIRTLIDGWVNRGWSPSKIRQHLFDRIDKLIAELEAE